VNTYVNGANTTAPGDDSWGYWRAHSPQLLNLVSQSTVSGAGPGAITQFIYDCGNGLTHGNVTQENHWDSASSSWLMVKHGYDSANPGTCVNTGFGNPTYTTDARGNSTVYSYDSNSLYITQMVQAYGTPDARTFTFQHDYYSGLLLQKFDADHIITTNLDYDHFGRNTMIAENGVRTTTMIYNDPLRTIAVKSDLNTNNDGALTQTTYYDQMGRVRRTQDAAGNTVDQGHYIPPNSGISYDLVSNPYVTQGESTMGWTRTTRDTAGRVIAVQHFSGAALPPPWGGNPTSTGTAATSYSTNCTTSADEAGVSRTSCADGLGRFTSVVENGIGATTTYGYDALDNLTSVTQGSATRGFTYSSLKRLLAASNPESGTISYTYDPNGNLLTRHDARNITTTYTYDRLDEVASKIYSDATPPVTYTYNKSWLAQVQSSASTYSYVFDSIGRVKGGTQTTPTTGGQSYTFGATLKPTVGILSITYPNSGRVVTTEYDASGRPWKLAGQIGTNPPTNYVTTTSYQPHGAINQQTLGNGLVVSRCNGTACDNARLQPTYISAGNLLSITYGYSASQNNGNLLSQTITRGSQTWVDAYTSYDGANRLTSASESNAGTWSQNLCYDNLGNRWVLSYSGLPASTLETPQGTDCNTGPYASTNRITGWGYDAAGNVTTSGTGRTFIYDAENRQTSATVNGQTTTYKYDSDGRRVTKVAPSGTMVFVYDPFGNLAQEYGLATDSGTKYIAADHLGSTRLVTDSAGAASKCYDYLPFGEELANGTGGRGNCFGGSQYPTSPDVLSTKFTTKERDAETGLDFFGARYISSAQGRFMSPDIPLIDQHADNPQSWNLYAYGRNNPLRYSDPTGHCAVDGEKHNWIWCLGHDLGYVETRKEKQAEAQRYEEAKAAWDKENPHVPYWVHQMGVELSVMPMVGEVSIAGEGAEGILAARGALKLKPVNLPAWRTIGIDMEEVLSGHTATGLRAAQSGIKDLFPSGMTGEQIERVVREAYRYGEKVATQGERVLVRGQSNGLTIEMWVNRTTRTIETAYPKF
jgi:RHS repeat-associated protein